MDQPKPTNRQELFCEHWQNLEKTHSVFFLLELFLPQLSPTKAKGHRAERVYVEVRVGLPNVDTLVCNVLRPIMEQSISEEGQLVPLLVKLQMDPIQEPWAQEYIE